MNEFFHPEIRRVLHRIDERLECIMSAIDNLKAADDALKAEVTTALTDFAAALATANSANDPAIQAVADDMTALVGQIQAADPANAAPPPPPAA
jgi:hypothetical protein